jgi:hypothetical protein
MTFGRALQSMLRRNGYALVSEFVTGDRRLAVRLRSLRSSNVVAMYHSDAIELARGGATIAAIVHRNRLVFGAAASPDEERTTTRIRETRDAGGQSARPPATYPGAINGGETVGRRGSHL